MPVSFRVTIDPRAITGLIKTLDQAQELSFRLLQDTFREIEPQLRDELNTTPNKVKYPIQWTSDKQRKAFFASNGFGKGIPYKRTGTLNRSWRLFVAREPNGGKIVILNTAPYSKFVVGTFAKNDETAYKYIQQFHRNTGWQPAKPTAEFWVREALVIFSDKLQDAFLGYAT